MIPQRAGQEVTLHSCPPLHHLSARFSLKLMEHTVGHLLPEERVGCGARTIDTHGSFPHGFDSNRFTPGISPESTGCSRVTS